MSLLLAGLGFGQTIDAKNESRPDAGDDALAPLAGGVPLIVREKDTDPEEAATLFWRLARIRSVWQSLWRAHRDELVSV
jgi:hypothetical protein